jgi:hypothetical protein
MMNNPLAPVNANVAGAQVGLAARKTIFIWTNFHVKAHPIHVRAGGMNGRAGNGQERGDAKEPGG